MRDGSGDTPFDVDELRVDRDNPSLTQKVVEGLRNAVLSGRFVPGQRLVERTLCEMTGVSRTAVREALRSLEAEGLVLNIPNRGPTVATVSVEEAQNIYEVRGLLETRAVELFMQNAQQRERDLLLSCMHDMEKAYLDRNFEAVNLEKKRFYDIILTASGNRLIKQFLKQLYAKIAILRNMTMAQESRTGTAIDELRILTDAMLSGDLRAAKRACTRHVDNAARVAIEALEHRGGLIASSGGADAWSTAGPQDA